MVSLIPNCGIIQPGDHQILTLRTTPTEDSPKQGISLQLHLNAAEHTKVPYTVNKYLPPFRFLLFFRQICHT